MADETTTLRRFRRRTAPAVASLVAPLLLLGSAPARADLVERPAEAPAVPAIPGPEGRALDARAADLTVTEARYFASEPARVKVASATNLGLTLVIVGIVVGAAVLWFGATHEEWPW